MMSSRPAWVRGGDPASKQNQTNSRDRISPTLHVDLKRESFLPRRCHKPIPWGRKFVVTPKFRVGKLAWTQDKFRIDSNEKTEAFSTRSTLKRILATWS